MQNLGKQKNKKNGGITLIALVITIIVLLILAGVTIATLTGDNGILTKAQEASENTKRANAEEQVKLAVAASIGTDGKINMDTLNNELKKIEGLTYKGSPISDSNKITSLPDTVNVDGYDVTINGDGSVNIGDNNNGGDNTENTVDGVIIPDGFYYVGGTKDTGLVISDEEGDDLDNTKQGNQFVWIPVNQQNFETEFVRREGYFNGSIDSMLSDCGEADSTGINSKVTETTTTQTEAQAMYASVKRNGGFYVGRYEAGKDTNGKVVVKKGADVYNYISWSTNGEMQETEGTTGGAVELSRNFDTVNGYTDVTSMLIYGVQWDAVMKWMENISNPNVEGKTYIQDSTGMGWYNDNSGNTIHQTGTDVDSDKSNCVKNIYDLAGNVREWTMESYNADNRVTRGGDYPNKGSRRPASLRVGNAPSDSDGNCGFRLTLYLNS